MSQKLSLKKVRNWDTFKKDRLDKMSDSIINGCTLAKTRFDQFLYSEYDGLDTEKFIVHIKSLNEDERDDEMYPVLQAWIDWLSDNFDLNCASTKQAFSRLNKYLWYKRIKITAYDMKDELDFPEYIQEEKYAPSETEFAKIVTAMIWKYQGFTLGLASAGMRPVELMGTQKKHYTLADGNYKLEIPYYLTKKRISRTVYFSKEVSPYITKLLKEREDEDFVWTKRKQIPQHFFNKYSHLKTEKAKTKAIKRFATDMLVVVRMSLARKLKNLGYDTRYESTGGFKITLYSFRARFITKTLKVLDGDIVHAMVGHGAYLQTYQRRTDEEKLELFREIESEIMVIDQSKNLEKIRKLKVANEKVQEQDEAIKNLVTNQDLIMNKLQSLQESRVRYEFGIKD